MEPIPSSDAIGGLKQTLHGYLRVNEEVFLRYAGSKSLPDNASGIHQLRVSVKRLRSVFRYMEWVAPGQFEARDALQEVRKFFKTAGNLRDLHIREAMLDRFCDELGLGFPRYANLLKKEKAAAQVSLGKRVQQVRPQGLAQAMEDMENILSGIEEAELLELARGLLRRRMLQVRLVFPEAHDAERYHKVRVLLKESLYVLQLLLEASHREWDKKWVNAVKEAGERGGEWHDVEVFLHALDGARQQPSHVFPDERAFLRLRAAVQAAETRALERYRKQVVKVLEKSPFA